MNQEQRPQRPHVQSGVGAASLYGVRCNTCSKVLFEMPVAYTVSVRTLCTRQAWSGNGILKKCERCSGWNEIHFELRPQAA